MSKYVFYAPNPTSIGTLNEEESFHACRVLRIRKGDKIRLLDGVGGLYEATIDNIDAKKTSFTQVKLIENKPNPIIKSIYMLRPPSKWNAWNGWLKNAANLGFMKLFFYLEEFRTQRAKNHSIGKDCRSSTQTIQKSLSPQNSNIATPQCYNQVN